MTCIVGLVSDDTVWIGGDSAGVSGLDVTVRADQKVWKSGEFVYGFTGSFRMGQLLKYSFHAPFHAPHVPDYEYLVTSFIDAVRQCLKDGGFARAINGEEEGGTFLVGYRGNLYVIYEDYQVGQSLVPWDSVGCGAEYSLGSLWASGELKPRRRVELALQTAAFYSGGVTPPFVIVKVKHVA